MRNKTAALFALAAAALAGCRTPVTPENAAYSDAPPKLGCLFAEIRSAGRPALVNRMSDMKLVLTDAGAELRHVQDDAHILSLRHAGCAEEGCRFVRTDEKGRPGAYYLWRVKDPETGKVRPRRVEFGRIHGRGLFPRVEFRR